MALTEAPIQANKGYLTSQELHLFPEKPSVITDFKDQHLYSATQFDKKSLTIFIDRALLLARSYEQNNNSWNGLLRRKRLVTLFYQQSTRSRLTVEAAMDECGGTLLTETAESSAQGKGEPLEHSVRVVTGGDKYPPIGHIVALRHPEAGAAMKVLPYANRPILNCGDGNREHVFQGLKDIFFFVECLGGDIEELTNQEFTFYGDQYYSRVFHSTAYLLMLFKARMNLVAPYQLRAPKELLTLLKEGGSEVEPFESLEELSMKKGGLGRFLYVNRRQDNLITDPNVRANPHNRYELNPALIESHPHLIVTHAMPIDGEIPRTMDYHPQAKFFDLSDCGMPVAAAALTLVLNG